MAKRDKYRKNMASDFFDYTEGKLSDKERNAFERRMQKDPFASDAAEGFSGVSREEAEQDLDNAAGNIRRRIADAGSRSMRNRRIADAGSRSMRNRRIAWYSAAAAVASLMIVTTVFFRLNDNGLERFKTAPEMREAAREQTAPLQEGDVEQEESVGEDAMDQDEPVNEEVKGQDEQVGEMAKAQSEPVGKGAKEQEKVTGKGDKELEIKEEPSKKVMVVDLADEAVANEDHAFAWEKMDEEAAAGRYRPTEQRMAAPKAPPEPMTDQHMEIALVPDEISLDELDEIVVIGHGSSKKTNMYSTTAGKETDPSGFVEYTSAVPEKGLADFRSYVDSTLVFPALTETSGKEVVVLKFSVAPDGRPQNFRVIRAPDNEAFGKEAIRVVSEGPAWQPATRNGQYTEEDVRLWIVFRKD